MAALTDQSITELAAQISSRKVSPVELVKAHFARIKEVNDKVNAYVLLTEEAALAEAKQAEAEIMKGQYRGPLHGIPIGQKDLIETKGVRSTAASKVMANHVPTRDATVVTRWRNAGTIMLGKLNTHEWAYGPTNDSSCFGPARNPWNTACFSGGSSGGSGAAVALGMAVGATGTDTGGSIRIPSAACGITGLKPTYGRAPRAGIFPLCWSMDHPGPMARSVEDCALLLQPLVGRDPLDAATVDRPAADYMGALKGGVKGKRIGVVSRHFYAKADVEVERAVREAVKVLEGLGAQVEEVDIPDIDHAATAALIMYLSEGTAYHDDWLNEHSALFTDQVRTFLELGHYVLAKDYIRAQRFRTHLGQQVADAFERVDVLATPTLPITAQPIGQATTTVRGKEVPVFGSLIANTEPFNLTGLPTLALPCGFSSKGLPISLQLTGRPFEEGRVLAVGHAYQGATDWHKKRPKL
ncbi:MAG: amidase [Alphaproteobacteria bacterium]|nr:amidase [Alphaproteobacteria bacterium]